MNIRGFSSLVLVLALLSAPPAHAGDADEVSDRLTRQMQVNQQRYGIAGQAVWVAHDGKLIFRGASGYADTGAKKPLTADQVFPVYSLSKLFASTLVMQLLEHGQLQADRPAREYLPGLPASWRAISVRQFLDHESGVPEYFQAPPRTGAFAPSREAALSALEGKPLLFPTGSQTRYTQTNFLVLAALLEAHYGQPYPRIVGERIIDKLALKHTWLGGATRPEQEVVQEYIGKNGQLREDEELVWPAYAVSHADLYTTVDDLGRFLQALSAGELVGQDALQRFWQPRSSAEGRTAGFATGWESSDIDGYREVGHDGGTKVRARIAFQGSLQGDRYIFIYLTNGSAGNVWSRTLVGSAMAAVAPARFPTPALTERLIGFATQASPAPDEAAMADAIRAGGALRGAQLERAINNSGYAIREHLGVDAAIRVFRLNTRLFPDSANAWDSLAEAHAARGDQDEAKALYAKARAISQQSKQGAATGE